MADAGRSVARRTARQVLLTAAALTLTLPGGAAAQEPGADAPAVRTYHLIGSRIAIGRSVTIDRSEEVRDGVFVVGGDVRVNGRVREAIVAVGGNVELGPEADVLGDVVLVGGTLARAPDARIFGNVSYVSFGSWWPHWTFNWGFDEPRFWSWLGFAAATARLAVLAVLMAFIVLVARARVARVGRAAAAEPARALLVGLAAEVLFVPLLMIVSIALALTIIGIPLVALLVPFAVLAAIATALLGFTALACRLGEWIEDRLGLRIPSAIVATAIGFLVIIGPAFLARMVNVGPAPLGAAALSLLAVGVLLEFGAWTMGLGATLMTGFGRWSTTPPPIPTA
jgi:hypothetical protein